MDAITGPYRCWLSYNSYRGTASSLRCFGTAKKHLDGSGTRYSRRSSFGRVMCVGQYGDSRESNWPLVHMPNRSPTCQFVRSDFDVGSNLFDSCTCEIVVAFPSAEVAVRSLAVPG